MKLRRRPTNPWGHRIRTLAIVATCSIAAAVLPGAPAFADGDPAPVPFLGVPVDGTIAEDVALGGSEPSDQSVPVPAETELSTDTYSVELPAEAAQEGPIIADAGGESTQVTGDWQQLGDTPISIASTTEDSETSESETNEPQSTKPSPQHGEGTSTEDSVPNPTPTPSEPTAPTATPTPEPNSTPPTPDDTNTASPAEPEPATTTVTAHVLDEAEKEKEGLSGFALELMSGEDSATGDHPIAVSIDNDLLSNLYGADFSDRVQWVQAPATGNSKQDAAAAESLSSASSESSTVLTPNVSAKPTLLVAAGAPVSSTGSGSFAATPLSTATGWDVSAQTGDFSWDYPFRVPPAPAGPTPSLALSYNSQSVDGETSSTNNQTSAVGEGWSLSGGGFIERNYVSCATDGGTAPVSSGDQCWKTDNATISFGGHSGLLVLDATSHAWKLQNDDGSRIEHLVGTAQGCQANGTWDTDCWRLTTTDGTQYYFGLNRLPGWTSAATSTNSTWTVPVFGNQAGEPCYNATFSAASCTQAWRWNLDYVVDTHNNAEALYYTAETNKYLAAGTTVTSYTRGGQLDHIDYGLKSTTVYSANAATDRVTFGYDSYGRCNDSSHANCTTETLTSPATAPAHPTAYPDVPFDQLCTATCTGLVSPTFWTTGMLNSVTTKAFIGGTYTDVDVWTLSHSFPDPGDGTNAALWLTSVGHTGYSAGASIAEPSTTFAGTPMQNRVWVHDGLVPLDKWRIRSITTVTGAVISVNYMPQECTDTNAAAILASPETNTARCYPQWWVPQVAYPTSPRLDLFHKYVVASVIADPHTGGGNDTSTRTDYDYSVGHPAWRYDISPLTEDGRRTWSDYAGYDRVDIKVGDPGSPSTQQVTQYTFYQGMDGDQSNTAGAHRTATVTNFTSVPDSRWFAGQTKEARVLNGVAGTLISDTINSPWASAITANDGSRTARMTGDGDVTVAQPVSTSSTNRTTVTHTEHDGTYGYPTTVNKVSSDAGTVCTKTDYTAPNTTKWIIGLPKETQQVATACASLASAVYPAAAITDSKITYDGGTWGTAPSFGDTTKTEIADSYTGTTAATVHYVTASQNGYDSMGRVISTTDVLGHTTSTAYTPSATAGAGSGPLTHTVSTNTLTWTRNTDINPAWGVETQATDENGKVTAATYDALGRRTGVWLPGRPQASNPTPTIGYAYTLSQTAPNSIATTSLAGSTSVTTFVLYDGLGRQVQSQSPAPGSGTAVTDTGYDTAGRVNLTNNPYWAPGISPSKDLFVPEQQNISSAVRTTYDGAGRTTATILQSALIEKSRTSYTYTGSDRVDMTPPAGGTPTSTFTNSLGQQTKLIQYLATTPSAPVANQEITAYAFNAQGKMSQMTDPAGNVWQWEYDVLGHQTKAIDPDAGTTVSTYDAAGNVITSLDGRNVSTFYTYDALNRKTKQYNGTSAAGTLLASWTYDQAAKGQLDSATSYDGTKQYSQTVGGYDDGYRPTSTTVTIPTGAPAFAGDSFTTNYTYTAAGDPQTVVQPAEGDLPAETIRYAYGATGQLNTVRGAAGSMLTGTVYTSIGQVAQYTRSNGAAQDISTYTYDSATGATSDIKETTVVGGTFTIVGDRAYTHDAAGNVTSATTTGNTTTDTQCFKYDPLRELTEAWTPSSNSCAANPSATALGGPAPYWTTYTLDAKTGNRTSALMHGVGSAASTTDTYTYPAAAAAHPHAVSSITRVKPGTTTVTNNYTYNGAGMTTIRPGQRLTWNKTGKIASTTTGTTTENDLYDASGQLLLQSSASGGATLFLGDTELHVATGGVATGSTGIRTYKANGTPFAERAGATLRWITTNVNGTPDIEVTTDTGTVSRRYQDPYGISRGTAVSWSHGYLNASASTVSGLTQLGARAYDTSIGKFLSVDPVLSPTNPQQNNGYAYSSNSPVTMADPSGLCPSGAYSSGCAPGYGNQNRTPGVYEADEIAAAAETPAAPGGGDDGPSSDGGGHRPTTHGGNDSGGTSIAPQGKQAYLNRADGSIDDVDWGLVVGAVGIGVLTVAVIACILATVGICSGIGVAAEVGAFAAEGAGVAALDAAAAAEAAEAAAAVGESESVGVEVGYKQGWDALQRAQLDAKVAGYNEGTTVVPESISRAATSASSRYTAAGGEVPPGYDVDHIIDLQLGGADTIENMAPLDMSVNRSLGAQIYQQIKNLPPGTVLGPFTIRK